MTRMTHLSKLLAMIRRIRPVAPISTLDASTMLDRGRKLVADRIEALPRRAPELVFSHIAHILRLQLLRAKLPTHVQRAFAGCDLFVPRAQIQQWPMVFTERRPHQPPAVGRSFQQTTVRTGTAVKGIRPRDLRTGGCHCGLRLLAE